MYSIRKPHQKPQKNHRKMIIITGGIILLLAGLLATLEMTNITHFFHRSHKNFETQANTSGRTNNDITKGENTFPGTDSGSQNSSNTNTGTTPMPSDEKQNTTEQPGAISGELIAPTNSTFVGNHRVSLGQNPAVQSNCVTSPGASCQIFFTKDSETKSLPMQTTDRGGVAYWTWKPKDISLSAGTWSVEAKATAGNQTKSASDSISLEVQP